MKIYVTGAILICSACVLLTISLFKKNDSFFNLREIFKQHFLLFRDARLQYLTFYVYPMILAVGISCFYIADATFYENLNVIVSILISMLLAIYSILAGKDIEKYDENRKVKIKTVIKETNNAITFSVVISIFLMFLSLVMVALGDIQYNILAMVFSILVYYLFIVLLLNILLIVKRLGKLV